MLFTDLGLFQALRSHFTVEKIIHSTRREKMQSDQSNNSCEDSLEKFCIDLFIFKSLLYYKSFVLRSLL